MSTYEPHDASIREDALNAAVEHAANIGQLDVSKTLEIAKQFYEFLKGDQN